MQPADPDHIDAIIADYSAPLAAFIRARVGTDEVAADILQDVWYQFSRSLAQAPIEHVGGWLYRVARNRIIDSYRRRSTSWLEDYLPDEDENMPLRRAAFVAADASPADLVYREQVWTLIDEALDLLPAKQREVFILNEIEGLTLREIAEQTGENLKTIISRKGYAVRRLREQLQELFDEWILD